MRTVLHDGDCTQGSMQPLRILCASQTMTPFGTQISSNGSLSLSMIRRWAGQDPARSCDRMTSQSPQQYSSASLICVFQVACLKRLRQHTTTVACPACLGALHCTTSESLTTHSRWSSRANSGATSAFRYYNLHNALWSSATQKAWDSVYFCRYPLISGDDKFMTRWIVSHGWKMSMQISPECTLATTFKADGKFFMQILRWTRNTWRSDFKSLVLERDIWYRYPVQVCTPSTSMLPRPLAAHGPCNCNLRHSAATSSAQGARIVSESMLDEAPVLSDWCTGHTSRSTPGLHPASFHLHLQKPDVGCSQHHAAEWS